mmetsp:Transcript_10463/g.19070  ORF Transcript_10463/g.19070 Transcript_10463/m.19070 type:complete len:213 (-) Transcript_10463:437-1075(-)
MLKYLIKADSIKKSTLYFDYFTSKDGIELKKKVYQKPILYIDNVVLHTGTSTGDCTRSELYLSITVFLFIQYHHRSDCCTSPIFNILCTRTTWRYIYRLSWRFLSVQLAFYCDSKMGLFQDSVVTAELCSAIPDEILINNTKIIVCPFGKHTDLVQCHSFQLTNASRRKIARVGSSNWGRGERGICGHLSYCGRSKTCNDLDERNQRSICTS